MPALGELLLTHRRRLRLSQRAASQRLGVAQQTLGRWETGTSIPGFDKTSAIAEFLEITEDEAERLIDSAQRAPDRALRQLEDMSAEMRRMNEELAALRRSEGELKEMLKRALLGDQDDDEK